MLPSIFGENLFDDFFDFPSRVWGSVPAAQKTAKPMMKADIRETDDAYFVDMDLPGFTKEQITAKTENGYLTITAEQKSENDETDKNGNYIRKERYSGVYQRSFYVGKQVKLDEIAAKLQNGILTMTIPKQAPQQIEEAKQIEIEG